MATTTKKANAPEGSCEQDMACIPDRDARIAELAYHKAEQRGFAPGHELDDWLEAEQECLLNESNNPRLAA
jgi:hypothetical protein